MVHGLKEAVFRTSVVEDEDVLEQVPGITLRENIGLFL